MILDASNTGSSGQSPEATENTRLQSEIEQLKRNEEVEKTIHRHVAAAATIGLIPLPLVDMSALIALQINLIRKIAKAYDIPFTKNKAKTIITSLAGAVLPTTLAPTMASFGKMIPLVGQTAGVVTMPILAGASTYATGRVFALHFESGGTFLNFDPEKAKERYSGLFKKGKDVVSEMKAKEETKTTGKPGVIQESI
uniref:Uncharacterized conserved protein, DUF697 family n=1 Tax=Candidatus Kentrum sp. FW TaxID=2126338 RepID=A0A450S116_9GAMM|nr:MAG: Uncharacterized conserved protein, DUF697 family [Candidatus Kentron sp. FW]VFJ60884.1 MAG: Uncharacterized conserved protein, DUF697 family [Candidatus Kentron sp. FW]